MLRQGLFSRAVHGLLEYVFGGLLIASPFLFGFDSGSATAVAIVLGVVMLVVAATADTPTGLQRSLRAPWHMVLDVMLAALLIASPFLFGFSEDGTATAVFIVGGVLWLLIAIGTRYERDLKRERGGAPAARSTP
jgi:VIT1/CCC1 family predicted Fe2+/Mn2+ transporter